MQINVKVNEKVEILKQNAIGTNNVNTIECDFELCEEFNNLVPVAVFTKDNVSYKVNIVDNKCLAPHEVLQSEGEVEFGVYGFEVSESDLVKRYSPIPTKIIVKKGSYKDGKESVDASPNSFEFYLSACNNAKSSAETSASNAQTSENNAKISEEKAQTSENNAKTSENNAKASEEKAKNSEANSKISEEKAKQSEGSAKLSENNAKESEKEIENIKNSIITEENKRVENEILRQSNEEMRVQNESTRTVNETTRIVAETNRNDAETARESNEETRIANEMSREEERKVHNNMLDTLLKDIKIEGTSIHVADSADYPCSLNIESKSEQVQTEQGVNLCPNVDSDKWALSGGAYKENGYIVLPQNGAKAKIVVEWNGQTANADGRYVIRTGAIFDTEDMVNAKYHINLEYLNANKEVLSSNGNAAIIGGNDIWRKYGVVYSAEDEHGAAIRDAKYIIFTIQYSSQFNSSIFKFKNPLVSKTSNDSYITFVPDSPSPEYPSPIENVSGDLEIKVVGKNLVTLDDLIKVGNANVIKEKGRYLIQSNSANPVKLSLEDLKLTNDYTIRFKIQALSNFEQFINFSNALNGSEHLHIHGSAIVNETIELFTARFTTNELYIYIGTSASTTNFQFYLSDFEIVEGSYTAKTMPEYEPYKEQKVIFPLAKGQKMYKGSYLADDGIHNKRKQIVFNGAENITKRTNTNNSFNFKLPKQSYSGICSHYKSFSSPSEIDTKNGIYLLRSNYAIFTDLRFTTAEELKTWLAEQYTNGTPVIIEYEVEKEETTPYTEEQQTAYNELQKLKTYRTVTNISNNQNTNMVLTYKKDLQTQFLEIETMLLESGV